MEIKYTKNLEPLVPFIKRALEVAKVDPKRIKRFVGYSIPLDKDDQGAAAIRHHGSGYFVISFRITEAVYQNLGNRKFKKIGNIKLGLGFLLDSIAHEISHVKNWEHDVNHYSLQLKIMRSFTKMLKELGVKDTSKPFDKALPKVEQ